ncbi:MAG: sugar phosphate isomerase/epimerase [Prolixibacteraceae bacterium]|nr:sugar phosphate isomerase/epimerase [Prolixibacteraceae bacterium]
MQLGISSYAYTWSVGVPGKMPAKCLSAFDLVDKAVALGVSTVQIADNLPLHEMSRNELTSLRDYAKGKGVQIEVGSRGMTLENVTRYLEIARLFRSPILRMVIDSKGFEPTLEKCIVTVKQLVPALVEAGVQLAIENHDRFKAAEFARIVAETDQEWTGICLDSVNSMGAGEGIAEVVKTLAPFTINLHLKEFNIQRVWHNMGFVVEGLPAGQGMLDIPWLLNEIRVFKRCDSAILELWTPPEEVINKTIKKEEQWVQESIRFLKPFFY